MVAVGIVAAVLALSLTGAPAVASSGTVVSGARALFGVACPSSTTCEAVGALSNNQGAVVQIVSGTPGKVLSPATGVLYHVACVSSTTCFAVGYSSSFTQGVVVPITNGKPGAPKFVSAATFLYGIARRRRRARRSVSPATTLRVSSCGSPTARPAS